MQSINGKTIDSVRVYTGRNWFMMGTISRLLWQRQWTFGFHKNMSWVAVSLQESLFRGFIHWYFNQYFDMQKSSIAAHTYWKVTLTHVDETESHVRCNQQQC